MKYVYSYNIFELNMLDGDYTQKLKYDTIYEDDNWKIIVPHNPFSSKEICGTDNNWCTNFSPGWDSWVKGQGFVLYRFIPKRNKKNMFKLTWSGHNNNSKYSWSFGYDKSPKHISTRNDNPFNIIEKSDDEIESKLIWYIRQIPKEAIDNIFRYQNHIKNDRMEK